MKQFELLNLLKNKIYDKADVASDYVSRTLVISVDQVNEIIEAMKAEHIRYLQERKEIAKRNNPNWKEGRPRLYSDEQIANALELLETNSYQQVVEATGISKSTLVRAKRKLNTETN